MAKDAKDSPTNGSNKISSAFAGLVSLRTLNRHNGLPRRAISMGVAAFLCFGAAGFAYHGYRVQKYEAAQTTISEGAQLTFSKTTTATMTVGQTQLNKDKTTAYIPFSFANTNDITLNANKYAIYVAGAGTNIKYNPTGQLVMFSNGRGVIMLHNSSGIVSEPLSILIKNNAALSYDSASTQSNVNADTKSGNYDDLAAQYDIINFTMNPASIKAKVNSQLTNNDKMSQLYSDIFGQSDSQVVNNANKNVQQAIQKNELVANNRYQQLKGLGYIMPKVPDYMDSSWRPYDAINPQTGELLNSNAYQKAKRQGNNVSNTSTSNNSSGAGNSASQGTPDDVDTVIFPNTLKKSDGTKLTLGGSTSGTDANSDSSNTVDTGGTSDSSNNAASSSTNINNSGVVNDSSAYQDLVTAWTNVLQLKHSLYTTNAKVLASIQKTGQHQDDTLSGASIGSTKRFYVMGYK